MIRWRSRGGAARRYQPVAAAMEVGTATMEEEEDKVEEYGEGWPDDTSLSPLPGRKVPVPV